MEYLVRWDIELGADTPREAAEEALKIQRDPCSLALSFEVYDETGFVERVDLGDDPVKIAEKGAAARVLAGNGWRETLDRLIRAETGTGVPQEVPRLSMLRDDIEALLTAGADVLFALDNMTTEEFAAGKDKPMRDTLRAVAARFGVER